MHWSVSVIMAVMTVLFHLVYNHTHSIDDSVLLYLVLFMTVAPFFVLRRWWVTKFQPSGRRKITLMSPSHSTPTWKRYSCVQFISSQREARAFLMSPPVWNLRAFSLIPLFYISSLLLLPSPVALAVLSFSAFGTFS